ncbi:MAG: hypothetical protein JWR03_3132 [Cohnella sp.]|nr:hypothetical protein [Cohnella sp.]
MAAQWFLFSLPNAFTDSSRLRNTISTFSYCRLRNRLIQKKNERAQYFSNDPMELGLP